MREVHLGREAYGVLVVRVARGPGELGVFLGGAGDEGARGLAKREGLELELLDALLRYV